MQRNPATIIICVIAPRARATRQRARGARARLNNVAVAGDIMLIHEFHTKTKRQMFWGEQTLFIHGALKETYLILEKPQFSRDPKPSSFTEY